MVSLITGLNMEGSLKNVWSEIAGTKYLCTV